MMKKTLNIKANKAVSFITALSVSMFMLQACSDKDEPESQPEPEPATTYTLKYNSMRIVEQKHITPDNKVQEIVQTDVEKYFGKRAQLTCPTELKFKEDSLFINKAGGLIEGYKMKWDSKKLMLFNPQTDRWEYCGEQKEKQFILNNGIYLKKNKENTRRALSVMGQSYALDTYTGIVDSETSTYWLQMNYTFQ